MYVKKLDLDRWIKRYRKSERMCDMASMMEERQPIEYRHLLFIYFFKC